MFEQSLLVSGEQHLPARLRWVAVASVAGQCALAGLLVALPLLHPERLVLGTVTPAAPLPELHRLPPPTTVVNRARAAANAAAPALTAMVARVLEAPRAIPHGVTAETAPEAMPLGPGFGPEMMGHGNLPAMLGETGTGLNRTVVTPVVPRPARVPAHVSAGVSAGMLLTPITPAYPAIARAAHVSGAVVVAAVISKEGRIERLAVMSGPAMLRGAAVEAIERARYRPYLLNGEPTSVETTITVNFQIGG